MAAVVIAVRTGCVVKTKSKKERVLFTLSLWLHQISMETNNNANWTSDFPLSELLNTCSPSCREYESATIFREWLNAVHYQPTTDILGNVTGCINPSAEFKVLLSAHMDEIGLQITYIDINGLLFFRRVGGIEPMSLCGHEVIILNKKEQVHGIIGRNAQNNNFTENGLSFEICDLWIDIGVETQEEAMQKVSIGDFVSFKPNYHKIGQNKIYAKGLDNKIGLYIIAQTLKALNNRQVSIGIYAAGTVQEEIKLRGIAPCAYSIKPNIGFVIDVGFATDIPGVSKYRESEFCLGKGIGLIHNADNNIALVESLKEIAEAEKIPIQESVGKSLSGGTDATKLQLTANGVATANISIPCRYMHSHTEICDVRDIECAIDLLTKTIVQIDHVNK